MVTMKAVGAVVALLLCHSSAVRERVSTAAAEPPDFREGEDSLFVEHVDVFGQPDETAWSTKVTEVGNKNMKVILTSDLFGTGKKKLLKVLNTMLGEPGDKPFESLWLRDARAGWDFAKMAKVFMTDTEPEFKEFHYGCNMHSRALWVNRWGKTDDPITLSGHLDVPTEVLKKAKAVTVNELKEVIDRTSVLYVSGGNPFTLMTNLRQDSDTQEIWSYIRSKIEDGKLIYIGRSAGSIVAGHITDISQDPTPENWEPEEHFKGLNLLPWPVAIRPHFHMFPLQDMQKAHSGKWRQENALAAWNQDDLVDNIWDKYPGVHPIRLRQGEFLAYYEGRASVMHD